MSIRVEQLTKEYGAQRAVDGVSFEIPKGQVLGFLGPNGAGKSTTMKMITGFVEPSAGQIEVCGINTAENPMAAKAKIGYLPESNPLYYDMFVKEYLHFVARIYRLKSIKTRVQEMVELTGLTREQHKKIGQLSKGYKQRVGLAQAMIHDPEVLILDEPTSGLDPNQLEDIRSLIVDLGKEKTVILSTHIMQEVEAMCERVIILNKGKIVADNKTGSLKSSPKKRDVVWFKVKDKQAKDFNLEHIRVTTGEAGFLIAEASNRSDLAEEIYRYCVERGYVLQHLAQEQSSLEDVFKNLTK